MNPLEVLDAQLTVRLTQALLHFLWQGAAVALLVALAGRTHRRASANVRYSRRLKHRVLRVLTVHSARKFRLARGGFLLLSLLLASVVVAPMPLMPRERHVIAGTTPAIAGSNMDVIQQRLAQKLPDWLRPLHGHGLVARIDDDDEVTEITAGSVVDDDLLAKLKTLPKLRNLYVETSQKITGRGLGHIGEMPALQSLQFYSVTLPDDGLVHLRQIKDLRELSLTQSKLNDAALAHLNGLKELRVLRLGGNRLTDAGLAHLTDMKHLEVLEIANTSWVESRMRITDAGLAHVARFTTLRELDISGLSVTDEGFAHLSGLRDLRRLRVRGTQITGDGLKHLANFPQLESLSLGGPWFNDAGMEHVAKCRNLRQLFLVYTKIGDEGFQHVGKLGKLERLTLDSHFVTDAGLAHLTSLENLKHIELRASRVTDESLKHISKIASLARLDLSGSGYPGVRIGRNFTGTGYACLAAMPNLTTLYLNNADVGWTELRGLKQLKSMALLMPTMSEDDVRQLQRALPDTYVSAMWGGTSVPPLQMRKRLDEKGEKPRPGAGSGSEPEEKPADGTAVGRAADLAPPVRITAGGRPIDVEGFAAPFVGDFDEDGKNDLLVGQCQAGRLRIFQRRRSARFAGR